MERYIRSIIEQEAAMPEADQALYHTNCAENLLRSANEKYRLGLDERWFRAICTYGAGMQTEHTCGALLAVLNAIGVLYAEPKPTENLRMKAMTAEYVRRFIGQFNSIACDQIKLRFRDENDTCTPVKVMAGRLMDQLIADEEAVYSAYIAALEETETV